MRKIPPIKVLVVASEAIPRVSMMHLIASDPGYTVVGVADSRGAVAGAKKLKPNLVVVRDVGEPDLTNLTVSLHTATPGARVVILGHEMDRFSLGRLFAAGAVAYVPLTATPRNLFSALYAASCGRTYVDSSISETVVDLLVSEAAVHPILSWREQQVLRLLVRGQPIKEIASCLGIGRKSAETYLRRIRNKLNVHTRGDIIRRALEMCILGPVKPV